MGNALTLGKITDKDIELCRTTNERISNQATQLLMKYQIPFTIDWVKIPFFRKEKYRGANQFYIIRTNPSRYSQARRAIDEMDAIFRQRLVLSNY